MFSNFLHFSSPSNRSSLIISSPVSPTSSAFMSPGSSISEAPTSPPATSSDQASESLYATEVASLSSGASVTEEEEPASLAAVLQNEAPDVAEADFPIATEPKDGDQAEVLEKPVSLSEDTPQKVEAFAKNMVAGILTEAVLEAASKGQIVHRDSEDATLSLSISNSKTSDLCEKEGSSLPCLSSEVPSPPEQEVEPSEDTQNTAESEKSNDQESESSPSNALESLQDSGSSNQAEAAQEDVPSNTNSGLTSTVLEAGAIDKMQPHQTEAGEGSSQQHWNTEDDASSDGSIEETEVSPKVINTQVRYYIFPIALSSVEFQKQHLPGLVLFGGHSTGDLQCFCKNCAF